MNAVIENTDQMIEVREHMERMYDRFSKGRLTRYISILNSSEYIKPFGNSTNVTVFYKDGSHKYMRMYQGSANNTLIQY